MFYRIINLLDLWCSIGVLKEPNPLKHKYIYLSNAVGMLTFVINSITGILFYLFIDNKQIAIACIFSGFLHLSTLYLNWKGHTLLSRIMMYVYANNFLLLYSCLFSHDSGLDGYFLIVCASTATMFDKEEKKWMYQAIFWSVLYYIVESTPLQNYLPHLNLLQEIETTNMILLLGKIVLILGQVHTYAWLSNDKERQLTNSRQQLITLNRSLELQNEDLKAFASAASHDIKGPVFTGKTFLHVLKKKLDAGVDHISLQECVNHIESSFLRIEQLVKGLLAHNQIDHLSSQKEYFDAKQELNSIIQHIKGSTQPDQQKIQLPEGSLLLKTNRVLFSIVIQNLIDNGLKYNESILPEVKLSFRQNNDKIIFTIQDNGVGIPEEYIEQAFKPFKRLSSSVGKEGNGLGLASARKAAEKLGGHLIIKRSSVLGSEFEFELPIPQ